MILYDFLYSKYNTVTYLVVTSNYDPTGLKIKLYCVIDLTNPCYSMINTQHNSNQSNRRADDKSDKCHTHTSCDDMTIMDAI